MKHLNHPFQNGKLFRNRLSRYREVANEDRAKYVRPLWWWPCLQPVSLAQTTTSATTPVQTTHTKWPIVKTLPPRSVGGPRHSMLFGEKVVPRTIIIYCRCWQKPIDARYRLSKEKSACSVAETKVFFGWADGEWAHGRIDSSRKASRLHWINPEWKQ